MSVRLRLDDLPPAMRAQALRQANAAAPSRRSGCRGAVVTRLDGSDAVQGHFPQSVRRLNKTEGRFLRDWPPGDRSGLILAQALTLPFGDGTCYRPDFIRISEGRVTAYEVKGGHVGRVAWSRHGIERFRRAREAFPCIRFELWLWTGGAWREKAFPQHLLRDGAT